MCVAVLVESLRGPTPEELQQMEDSNPHGAGIAWADRNLLRYRKGLTAREISAILPLLPRPTLLHFRWATHGPKVPHLTHPFPLGKRALHSRASEGVASSLLIHNGTWGQWERHIPRGVSKRGLSDTAVAAYMAGFDEDILDEVPWATAVGRAAGHDRMDVTLRGSTWESHNGDTYSNMTWQWDWRSDWASVLTPLTSDTPEPASLWGSDTDPRWLPDGRLASRGTKVPALTDDDKTIEQWLDEQRAAVEAHLRGKR